MAIKSIWVDRVTEEVWYDLNDIALALGYKNKGDFLANNTELMDALLDEINEG